MTAAEKMIRELDIDPISLERDYQKLCAELPLRALESKEDHNRAMEILTGLQKAVLEMGEGKVSKGVFQYLETLGILIEAYEKKQFPNERVSGTEMLAFLKEQNGLSQEDLAEDLGSQGVVSEILSGKRQLNKKQIAALARRFHVSPAVFFEDDGT
jgi:HTH-type transcriptional regulator / antitoxin HigA